MTHTQRHLEAVSEAMGHDGEITADVMDRLRDTEDHYPFIELATQSLNYIGELQHLRHACGNYLQLVVRYTPCPECQQTMCLYCGACRKVLRLCPCSVTEDEGYALELG